MSFDQTTTESIEPLVAANQDPISMILELAATTAATGVWRWDLVNSKVEWDESLCNLYQAPDTSRKSGRFSEHWRKHVHPVDLAAAEQHIADALQGSHRIDQEYRVNLPDGTVRQIRSEGLIESDSTGRPVRAIGFDRDITEEKRLETELREKAGRLDLVVDALNLGIWSWDLVTGELLWDQTLCDIYQVPETVRRAGMYYAFWQSRVHPEDIKRVENDIAVSRKNGTPFESAFRIVRPDGSVRLIRSVGTFESAADGTPIKLIGLNRDITDSARKESLLQDHVTSLNLAAEASGFGVWSWDLGSNQSVWDERKCAMYQVPESVRKSGGYYQLWQTRLHPDDRKRAEDGIGAARDNGATYDQTYRIILPDGSIRHVRTLAIFQRSATGTPLRMIGIDRDITAEVQREARLQESEDRLRQITDSVSDGIILLDAESAVTYCNPAAEKILGYGSTELLGMNLPMLLGTEFTHAGFRPAQAEFQQPGRGSLVNETRELTAKRKDGSEVAVAVALGTATIKGVPHAVAVIQDISERKRLEAERLRLEKGRADAERQESLGLLAGGIAHDFNNLHGGILNATELISRSMAPGSPQQALITNIRQAAQRASELAHQMLSFSGKASITLGRHSLNDLVGEAIRRIQYTLPDVIQVVLNPGADLPDVEGDKMQLQQVVSHLVVNAAEALAGRAGRIAITTKLTETALPTPEGPRQTRTLPPGSYVCLEITDSGSGISPEIQAKIFDPFFTTKELGRGLGLSFVLGVVRGHRGAITVDSAPARGSRFSVMLPRSPASVTPTPQPPVMANAPALKDEICILLADDDDFILRTTAEILRMSKFKVVTARDGREAVDLYQASPNRFDLVVTDFTMPRLDGAQAVTLMREINPDLRVVVVSGYPSKQVGARFAGGKPNEYLMKPFTITELLARIHAAMAATKAG